MVVEASMVLFTEFELRILLLFAELLRNEAGIRILLVVVLSLVAVRMGGCC